MISSKSLVAHFTSAWCYVWSWRYFAIGLCLHMRSLWHVSTYARAFALSHYNLQKRTSSCLQSWFLSIDMYIYTYLHTHTIYMCVYIFLWRLSQRNISFLLKQMFSFLIAYIICYSLCQHILRWYKYILSQLILSKFWIQCKVCMQTFMCTTSEVKCREHAEAKHPKADVYACFPHLKKWSSVWFKFFRWGKGYRLLPATLNCLQHL